MKFNPAQDRFSRSRLHVGGLIAATCLFAAHRGTATAAPSAEAEGAEEDTGGEEDVTSQGTGTGTGTGTDTGAKTAATTKNVTEASTDTGLLELVKAYDDVKEKANSYMCDMAEYIGKNNLGRPVVMKTLMEARGVTLETAASSASRLIKLAKDPEAIKGLRDGSLTVRETLYGRPKPGTTATTGDGGTTAGGGKASGKTDSEKKEDRYNRQLAEFIKTAKECGFSLDEIVTGVRASLKDAGVK